eukprot:COSAG01_NODE_3728_length_5757_cov_7.514493_10_plen_69_part_00
MRAWQSRDAAGVIRSILTGGLLCQLALLLAAGFLPFAIELSIETIFHFITRTGFDSTRKFPMRKLDLR